MRVAVVAESFLPHVNGVTGSVLRVLEHLQRRGHEAMVLAPSLGAPPFVSGAPVIEMGAVGLPGYPQVRVAVGQRARIQRALEAFGPDVVHLASPFVLGWHGLRAAENLGLPTVAVYQTEVPGYAARYGMRHLEPLLWRRVHHLHERATLTLAPSSAVLASLTERGLPRLRLWGRGVDATRFRPAARSEPWRALVGAGRPLLVGYVGRLAPEKQVEDLRALAGLPHVRLVVVGDGPERETLERLLPDAHFTGLLRGPELARAVASLDVLVHPGELETFGQTLQEAHASGVPVVAPAAGGPIDIVDHSRTGWLYAPGDLTAMRERVVDLLGDDRKRAAFGAAARARAVGRTWPAVCDELLGHYRDAIATTSRLPV
ncbi:glycosyl transferase group 1 [Xylanimonas cellulosilytica DSM 15894]|uniref:D-inositol 3-phosphate glycosyltransferase n=1 Tax=Xylanimonas cellulosilytica (strain DSM 15894 / JCM 12276 / CECT 5975 / KCTC 9989 / LMG 20990 / NBRC 107835 / XIL07) TaxID=446471 RepID=D1BUL8_XYLCX|nr:glycosyltransferase family 1 protein [Xylanimonas cellulosilytica]ACZ29259.1 glycosyl transferase group 1 [Xylanimonas cellulosilytica DSM 15894]